MTIIQLPTGLVCPFCQGTSFSAETKGLISKTTKYQCLTCGSALESKDDCNFTIVQVADAYSNTNAFMQGRKLALDKLKDPNLPILSDDELADISNATGDFFERILAEADQKVMQSNHQAEGNQENAPE